jgi:hypothetical protein
MAKASNLVPLLVLFVFVAIAAFIGFIAYSVATDVSDKAAKRMEKKNIKFTKEGMKVGVKEISTEDISDSTQSYVFRIKLGISDKLLGCFEHGNGLLIWQTVL